MSSKVDFKLGNYARKKKKEKKREESKEWGEINTYALTFKQGIGGMRGGSHPEYSHNS